MTIVMKIYDVNKYDDDEIFDDDDEIYYDNYGHNLWLF